MSLAVSTQVSAPIGTVVPPDYEALIFARDQLERAIATAGAGTRFTMKTRSDDSSLTFLPPTHFAASAVRLASTGLSVLEAGIPPNWLSPAATAFAIEHARAGIALLNTFQANQVHAKYGLQQATPDSMDTYMRGTEELHLARSVLRGTYSPSTGFADSGVAA